MERLKWKVSRREVLARAWGAVPLFAFRDSLLRAAWQSHAEPSKSEKAKLKVMVTGGHPGDPECGCGGTILRYSDAGHDVVLTYLNSGQAFCSDDTGKKNCGEIRTAEARKACGILRARLLFAGQFDGKAIVDTEHYDAFKELFDAERPDVV